MDEVYVEDGPDTYPPQGGCSSVITAQLEVVIKSVRAASSCTSGQAIRVPLRVPPVHCKQAAMRCPWYLAELPGNHSICSHLEHVKGVCQSEEDSARTVTRQVCPDASPDRQAEQADMLFHEAELATQLQQRGIMRPLGWVHEDGMPYPSLVMPLAMGGSLDRLIGCGHANAVTASPSNAMGWPCGKGMAWRKLANEKGLQRAGAAVQALQ